MISIRNFVITFLIAKVMLHILSKILLNLKLVNSVSFRIYSDNSLLLYTTMQELALALSLFFITNSLSLRLALLFGWHLLLYVVSFWCDCNYLILCKKYLRDTKIFLGVFPIVISHIMSSIPMKTLVNVHDDFKNFAILFTLYIFSIWSFEDY